MKNQDILKITTVLLLHVNMDSIQMMMNKNVNHVTLAVLNVHVVITTAVLIVILKTLILIYLMDTVFPHVQMDTSPPKENVSIVTIYVALVTEVISILVLDVVMIPSSSETNVLLNVQSEPIKI